LRGAESLFVYVGDSIMKTKARIAFVSAAILGAATFLAPSALKAQANPPPEYVKAIYEKVAQATVYPKMAKLHGQQGKVGCIVNIGPNGDLIDQSVEISSGTASLDAAAIDAIKRSAPYQAPPGGGKGATLHLTLNFALAD
jgi:protein TonB